MEEGDICHWPIPLMDSSYVSIIWPLIQFDALLADYALAVTAVYSAVLQHSQSQLNSFSQILLIMERPGWDGNLTN